MGFYRKMLLFVQGLMYDTKNGYSKASKFFNETDLEVNVTGLDFLVTGANSGIGFETAKAIAEKGGTVHLVCRNENRAKQAKTRIVEETGNERVYVYTLDLSRMADVQAFVNDFASEHDKLDVLINNAGEMCSQLIKTEAEGFERNFATNVAGPFVLTIGLLPLLKRSSRSPRVVTVGSAGMLLQRLDASFFEKCSKHFDGMLAYAQCKRQMAILTDQWAKEHDSIHFSCMHPGWVDTPAARRGLGEFYEKMKDKFRDSYAGADTVIWLAISKSSLTTKSGSYFQDRKRANKHLFLARTKESKQDRVQFVRSLSQIADSLRKPALPVQLENENSTQIAF